MVYKDKLSNSIPSSSLLLLLPISSLPSNFSGSKYTAKTTMPPTTAIPHPIALTLPLLTMKGQTPAPTLAMALQALCPVPLASVVRISGVWSHVTLLADMIAATSEVSQGQGSVNVQKLELDN